MDGPVGAIVEARRDIITRLKAMLIESLNLEMKPNEIAEDSSLFGIGIGLDSIDALVIIVGIEDAFGVSIPTDEPHIYRSINTIADFVESQLAGERPH
jgi:acyl carrier protein